MLLTAIVILLLASAAAFALVTVARVRRAYNKRRLLAETPGVTCDGIDCMGISAVCSGITDEKQIENLLSVEYARYEVVLVLDAQRDTQAFRRIAARYQLIGVNCHPSEELPAAGIRGLYRARASAATAAWCCSTGRTANAPTISTRGFRWPPTITSCPFGDRAA